MEDRRIGSEWAGRVGAVVLGGDYQGLGIVRSLGRRGIPVCVIDDELSIARFSRFTQTSIRVAGLKDPVQAVRSIQAVGRLHRLDGWVIYPTRDELVAAVSQHRGCLQEQFRVPTPGWESVRIGWDKRLTHELATRLGIPSPRTTTPGSPGELARVEVRFPVALKPAIKEHFFYTAKVKALRADNHRELRAAFRMMSRVIPAEEIMVQELIPGGGEDQYSYCALCRDGVPLATMTARRARQHPPDFGRASTFVETVDRTEIQETSELLLAALRYDGLVEVEYKLDRRDGRYKLLDVNMRTWGYHTLGAAAGVDFPWLLFRHMTGERLTPLRARSGVRWVRLATDLPTAIGEIARGRLGLCRFLGSLLSADEEAVFALDDPLPSLGELLLLPHLYLHRGVGRWRSATGRGRERGSQ